MTETTQYIAPDVAEAIKDARDRIYEGTGEHISKSEALRRALQAFNEQQRERLEMDEQWNARCSCCNASFNGQMWAEEDEQENECAGCGRTVRLEFIVEDNGGDSGGSE